jgi:hypothetical protein
MGASFSHLADQLYALLPRELRNEIYSYLWADSVLDALDIQLFPVARVKGIPEFARTLVVGTEIAREAVEWLYVHKTSTVQSPSQIKAFLETDLFRVGVTPLQVKLQALTVEVPIDVNYVVTTAVKSSLERILRHDLKERFQLNIEIRPIGETMGLVEMCGLGPQIKAVMNQLKKKGGLMKVTWIYKVADLNIDRSMLDHSEWIAFDVTHMMGVGHLEWENFSSVVIRDAFENLVRISGQPEGGQAHIRPRKTMWF